MRKLLIVIFLKILLTFFWVIGLALPLDWLHQLGAPDLSAAHVFIRLLSAAFFALLVGYVFGAIEIIRGSYPRNTVWVGIISNGGATIVLLLAAMRHEWTTAPWNADAIAPKLMTVSLFAVGLITAGLIAFGPCGRHSASK